MKAEVQESQNGTIDLFRVEFHDEKPTLVKGAHRLDARRSGGGYRP
jgi:hypothetical protein